MAITNDEFSIEEVEQVLTKKPDLLNVLTSVAEKRGLTVLDAAKKTAYDADIESKSASTVTSKVATEVEATIKNLTGIDKKSPSEKWTEYYQRVVKELKDGGDLSASELTKLRGTANLTDLEKQRLEQLVDNVKTHKTEFETYKTSKEKEISDLKISNKITSAVSPLMAKANPLIPKRGFDLAHDDAVSQMTKMAEDVSGKLVFKSADGKVKLDKNGGFMSADDLYSEIMNDFLDPLVVKKGTGGGPDGPETGLPGDIKNQQQLSDWLIGQGKVFGTKAYTELWTKHKGSTLPRH